MLRDAADGFDIGRYIFTDNTIATGRSPNQLAVFHIPGHRKDHQFDLDHIFRVTPASRTRWSKSRSSS